MRCLQLSLYPTKVTKHRLPAQFRWGERNEFCIGGGGVIVSGTRVPAQWCNLCPCPAGGMCGDPRDATIQCDSDSFGKRFRAYLSINWADQGLTVNRNLFRLIPEILSIATRQPPISTNLSKRLQHSTQKATTVMPLSRMYSRSSHLMCSPTSSSSSRAV